MLPVQFDSQAARRQLEQVLGSDPFSRSEQLSRLLRFLVERHLEGRDQELKESVIAVEVFGRKPEYNPRHDPIVRTEARRLRGRLSEYYLSDGRADFLIIELPKGGYIPRFRDATHARTAASRPRLRLWAATTVAGVALVLAATGWWLWHHKSAPIPIAVLPLENLSQNPADDYFSDGLTYEIMRNLPIIDGVAVRSQTSSFAFKGKPRNVREAGKQLAADYLLEGSVLRAGQHLRINAQLVRARDDFPMWSGRYDRELTDVFAIQDEISRGIVNGLRLKLGHGRRRYETSVEAYDLYLHARALLIQHGFSGYDKSVRPFEEAIAKDPSFAPAYAGLAINHAIRSGQFRFDVSDALTKMRTAAKKAIELDPLSAEAHAAMGFSYNRDGRWTEGGESFRRSIEPEPNNSTVLSHFAISHFLPLGRVEEALHKLRVAEKSDPLSPEVRERMVIVLIAAGRYDEAAGLSEKLPADFALKSDCLGRARLFQGRTSEAIQLLGSAYDRGYLGYAYGRAGRIAEAEQLAASFSSDPIQQAFTFAGLGDRDRTLEAMERAAGVGPVRLGRLLYYPEMALLRGDPRLRALRKKIGLPE